MLPGCVPKDTHVLVAPNTHFSYIFCLKYRAFQFCKNCLGLRSFEEIFDETLLRFRIFTVFDLCPVCRDQADI